MISDDGEQQQKAKQAIENFIVQVNNIHLQLLQESSESPQKEEKKQSDSSPQEVKQ
jgi:hypothetical protein